MSESKIQTNIMNALFSHKDVSWAMVTTVGLMQKGKHKFMVGFKGLSDILGQMKDGRIIAIEVKVPGKKPNEAQLDFLSGVEKDNGVSGWCDSVEGALDIVDRARKSGAI